MASSFPGDYGEKNKSNTNDIRSSFLGKTGTDEAPLDRTYYNILNVSPTANPTEIKRAYYTLSLQYHPDRTQNLDDITRRDYAERFKLISQAYSILSDPEKRTLYNRYGKDERLMTDNSAGISLEDFDAEEFFRLMFGGEEFADIIGDIELAKSFKHVIGDLMNDADKNDSESISEQQQQQEKLRKRLAYAEERTQIHEERINLLSTILISKLSCFTDSFSSDTNDNHYTQSLNNFLDLIRSDIPTLLRAPYGEHLLHAVGYIYSSKARLWLSKMDSQEGHIGKRILGFGKHIQSSWKDRAHVIKETVKTVKCAVQCAQSVSKLSQIANEESNDNQMPFQHHSGHLEYNGFTPSESTASSSPSQSNTSTISPVKPKQHRKSSAQPIVPLTDEDKRKLEADMAAKSMEALWRVTKLEIESTERDVCDRVLNDSSCTREIRRYRCIALSKMGELWQQASLLDS